MPKRRINWREIYITFGIVGYILWMVDMVTAVPLDIFDLGDPQKEGLPEITLFGSIPSCLAVIYLNVYNEEKKWVLVIFFVILSLILEYGTTKVGLMKNYNNLWSTPIHFIAYAFYLPWHLRFIRGNKG